MNEHQVLAQAQKQLADRIVALRQRLNALEPITSTHKSAEFLQDMADALEQCLLTIDRTVMASSEKATKAPKRPATSKN